MSKEPKIAVDKQFGRLTVFAKGEKRNGNQYWWCRCTCGKEKQIQASNIPNITSCGCYHKEIVSKHGMYKSSEYRAWAHMIERCHNPESQSFKDYGARGISVCERWKTSFENFYADMGPKSHRRLEIERINNDGNYEPGNCKWATRTEQNNNTRRTHRITFNGETLSLKQWARKLGIAHSTLDARINRYGWSIEQALNPSLQRGVKP